jgi:predicted Zn-dependent protease
MKHTFVILIVSATFATPAYAQLGGLGGIANKARQAQDAKQKLDDLTFSEAEERTIGEDVSAKLRTRFGVVQDPAVHKYVTLVGTALAQKSDRPALAWTFIVLDTDGVNAFAAPGGFVHITRGALGLIKNEGELAGVLGHEIGHVTRKHTINAIRKSNAVKIGADAASTRAAFMGAVANAAYANVIENAFDRGDEMDADKVSVELTQKAVYAAGTLADFLTRLDDRNKDMPTRNGMFASHPDTKIRIDAIRKLAEPAKTTALAEARYKSNIKYEPTAVTAIATVVDGAAGLAGSGSGKSAKADDSKKPAPKKEEPPKKGFGLAAVQPTVAQEKQSSQVTASGGSRGVGPDRDAKGGGNPAIVKVTVSAAEVEAFKKGIA